MKQIQHCSSRHLAAAAKDSEWTSQDLVTPKFRGAVILIWIMSFWDFVVEEEQNTDTILQQWKWPVMTGLLHVAQ